MKLVVALAALLSPLIAVGCNLPPDVGMEVGVTERDGQGVGLVAKCSEAQVDSVELATRRTSDGTGGKRLWRVERSPGHDSAGGLDERVFEFILGDTPTGFTEVHALQEPLPSGELTLNVEMAPHGSYGVRDSGFKVFEAAELRPDVILVPGYERTFEDFRDARLNC